MRSTLCVSGQREDAGLENQRHGVAGSRHPKPGRPLNKALVAFFFLKNAEKLRTPEEYSGKGENKVWFTFSAT